MDVTTNGSVVAKVMSESTMVGWIADMIEMTPLAWRKTSEGEECLSFCSVLALS